MEEEGRRRKKKRGYGRALSLETFVKTKNTRSALETATTRKRREEYQNAKKVNNYKRLVKQLGLGHANPSSQLGLGHANPPSQVSQEKYASIEKPESHLGSTAGAETWRGPKTKKAKSRNTLEKLRHEFEQKKEEEQQQRKARLETAAAKKEAKERALKARKELKAKMWKKTQKGQPVMKYRLEHILESLNQGQH